MNKIDSTAQLFKEADVFDSVIGRHSIIGDYSRIRHSYIEEFCSIDRQNFLLNVKLGKRSYTGPWDMIFRCQIGKYCSISYGVTIGPPEHNYTRISTHPFIYDGKFGLYEEDPLIRDEKFKKDIVIGNDVWIGCNSTLLRGITVGDGAVIAANSVVTKDVPPYSIVAGTPARIIKFRFDNVVINRLLELSWWDWDDEIIRNNLNLFKKANLTIEDLNSLV